jgi:ribosomal protein L11 methyltransferase
LTRTDALIPAGTDFLEISVAVDGEAAEAVCELFERYGSAVIELLVAAPDGSGRAIAPRALVKTFVGAADEETRGRIEEGLWHLSRIVPLPDAVVRTLAAADWTEAWKSHYTVQRIGRRLVITPSWSEVDQQHGDIVIRLDPGMAFGTGLHPTTRLCLRALEDTVQPNASLLDVGTGSGILAIAASRLGAAPVVACDIDPAAVDIAAHNAAANDAVVDVRAGPIDVVPAGTFDLVVANILADVITGLAPLLAGRLAPNGTLIVSGILEEQAPGVRSAIEACGLRFLTEHAEKDWIAFCFTTS